MLIVLAADDNYAMPCGVCITSILTNNKSEDIKIAILTTGLNDDNINRFKQTASRFNRGIEIKIIEDSIFQGLQVSDRFPQSIYFRFLIPILFPQEKIALYLDCDIVVNGDIKPLFNVDLASYACACVGDQCGDDIRLKNSVPGVKVYFNSGVMLLNLEYWRKHNISKKCIEYISNHGDLIYPDQEALNNVLIEQVKIIGYEWNFQELLYLCAKELFLSRDKWQTVEQAKLNPVIIHYTRHLKPWHVECEHPLKDLFIDYQKVSGWEDVPIKKKYPAPSLLHYFKRACSIILNRILKLS